jgi:hypothetical protein
VYPELAGKEYGEVRRQFGGAAVCGYIRASKQQGSGGSSSRGRAKVHINCHDNHELEAGDQVVLVAPCIAGIKLLQQPIKAEQVGAVAVTPGAAAGAVHSTATC